MKIALILICVLFAASGCGLLFNKDEAASGSAAEAVIELDGSEEKSRPVIDLEPDPTTGATSPSFPNPKHTDSQPTTVELLWQVPNASVTAYHLSYGFDRIVLDNQLRIPINELEKIDHPTYGPVFRYYLNDVPVDKDVFISLALENAYGISKKTEPMKVERAANLKNNIGMETR